MRKIHGRDTNIHNHMARSQTERSGGGRETTGSLQSEIRRGEEKKETHMLAIRVYFFLYPLTVQRVKQHKPGLIRSFLLHNWFFFLANTEKLHSRRAGDFLSPKACVWSKQYWPHALMLNGLRLLPSLFWVHETKISTNNWKTYLLVILEL